MQKSTVSKRAKKSPDRPKKPYEGFPLSPHPGGKWQKKINGEIKYFGRWGKIVNGKMERLPGDGWQEALELYKAQADDLHAGRMPRAKLVNGVVTKEPEGLTVGALCNTFLNSMLNRLKTNRRMSARMFDEYRATTDRLVAKFGTARLVDDLRPSDFESLSNALAEQYGPTRRGNEIQKVRTVFKYAFDNELIAKPVRYGTEFRKPDKTEMRKNRASKGKRLFAAEQVKQFIESAGVPLKAMILLGINCGFGAADCGSLSLENLDLDHAWIDYPRPKTGIGRRCPLWAETVTALKQAIAERPEPKSQEDSEIVFLTKYRKRWVRTYVREKTDEGHPKHTPIDSVGLEFRKLIKAMDLTPDGRGFYSLRHTFRTVADATKDNPAIRVIMGHADGSIDDTYREDIDDSRLRVVVDHVRSWLYPTPAKQAESEVQHA